MGRKNNSIALLNTVIKKLMEYVGKSIAVEICGYSICTEEDHGPHGWEGKPEVTLLTFSGFKELSVKWDCQQGSWERLAVRDVKEYIKEESIGSLENLCVCGFDQKGNEVAIPFKHPLNWVGGYGYTVITKIRSEGIDLFVPKIIFNREKGLFDYLF